jgi:hypothetical protein
VLLAILFDRDGHIATTTQRALGALKGGVVRLYTVVVVGMAKKPLCRAPA